MGGAVSNTVHTVAKAVIHELMSSQTILKLRYMIPKDDSPSYSLAIDLEMARPTERHDLYEDSEKSSGRSELEGS